MDEEQKNQEPEIEDATQVEIIEARQTSTLDGNYQTDIKLFPDLLVDPQPVVPGQGMHGLKDARNTHPLKYRHLVERFWHKTVPDLKQWLMQRGVTRNLSALRKPELIEIHYAYDTLKNHTSQAQPLKYQTNLIHERERVAQQAPVATPPPNANVGQLTHWLTQERSAADNYATYQGRTLEELKQNCRGRGLIVDGTLWKEEVIAILMATDIMRRYQEPTNRSVGNAERSRIAHMVRVPSSDAQRRYAMVLAAKRGCEPLSEPIAGDKYLVAEWIGRNKRLMSARR